MRRLYEDAKHTVSTTVPLTEWYWPVVLLDDETRRISITSSRVAERKTDLGSLVPVVEDIV